MKTTNGIVISAPQKVLLKSLNPAVYNPRVMPPAKMRALKAALLKNGLVMNLVVQKKGLVIIGGHQRVKAMREICQEKKWTEPKFVWATVLDVDDSTAKQINISLNNTDGDFEPYKLGELFASMQSEMTPEDIITTGFTDVEVKELIELTTSTAPTGEGDTEPSTFARSITLSLEFDTVEERDKAKRILHETAQRRSKKTGGVVLEALRVAKFSSPNGSTKHLAAK